MIGLTKRHDVVVPKLNEFVEPLLAVYSRHCLIPIKRQLDRNKSRIQSFFGEVKVRYVGESEIKRYDPQGLAFFNVNTEEDLQKARSIAEKLKDEGEIPI